MCEAVPVTNLVLTFPDINPVAFRLGPLQVHWYAITYLVGFALAYVLLRRRLGHEPFRSIRTPEPYKPEIIEDILTVSILGVLLGGRLGYCFFYKPAYYLQHPLDIVKVWDGGMSFHGGAIGVFLGFVYLAWRQHRPVLQIADFVVPAAPLGLMCGRIGNFINGELWGRPAPESLPWAMVFPTGGDVPRHPSQLYQALMEGLLLFLLLWWYAARRNRYRGQVASLFVAGYGVFRFIGEYFREPDGHLGYLSLGLSMGQWLSVPMILGGLGLYWWATARRIDDSEPVEDEPAPVDESADNPVDNPGDDAEPEVDEGAPTPSERGAHKERQGDETENDTSADPEDDEHA